VTVGRARQTWWQVAVSVPAEAEDVVTRLLERSFGVASSAYLDFRKGTITISVFRPTSPGPAPAVRCQLRADLARLRQSGAIPPGRIRIRCGCVRRRDWAHAWKRHFRPLAIGGKLLVRPSWSRRRPRPHEVVVQLDPGLSFGTGHHPTTHFCLREIVIARRRHQVQSLLDLGTGSGILAIAAAKLGYHPVLAIDADAAAVEVARDNARQNHTHRLIRLQVADLRQLKRRAREGYDIVCANLTFDLLQDCARRIGRLVKPTGYLVLAGILRGEFGSVRQVYARLGFRLVRSRAQGEWRSGTFAAP
jgi:ribosomal protein L11 methyltransferase